MKILFLTHAQYITVALPKIIESAEQLVEMGHDVTIAATHIKNKWKSEKISKNGVQYILSPSVLPGKLRHGADPYDAFRRILLLRKYKFDIIHAVDSRPSVILPALYLKRSKKIPLILEWSDWFGKGGTISERSGWLYNKTLAYIETMFEEKFRMKADGATTITNKLYNRLVKMGFAEDKIHIHRMGCINEKFSDLNKIDCRNKLQLPTNKDIFTYFGRIHQGDHELLIKAFLEFNKKSLNASCLYLIGDIIPLDKYKNENIIYTGRVSDEKYIQFIGASDVCLLPMKINIANQARWPSKFTDYLAAGKPVVATAVSDFPQIFEDAKIGIMSESDDIDSFAKALTTISKQKELWDEYGNNAKLYSEQYLSWNVINKKLISFYGRFLK